MHNEKAPAPFLAPGHTYNTVTEKISSLIFATGFGKYWVIGFFIAFMLLNLMLFSIGTLLVKGIGVWGVNVPVGWGFDIINFVWWIGIGHAGTLISAILLLLNQPWRTSINRFAEAMTLFAVACAGMYPLLHTGRPWLGYWLLPYPNTMGLWPQWLSPLMWDVFAVSTYGAVSLLFWYVGLVPDFASLRDRSKNPLFRKVFGLFALGWRGSARHWARYGSAYMLLAGISTPLVLSVHTIVSFDFAVSVLPGWHTTIFPPYFVAGAIYSGFAMVLTLAIPVRSAYKLKDFITDRHLDVMAKVMLATGIMVGYGYVLEAFFAWYSANPYERFLMVNRMGGPYAWSYWGLILFNILIPQALWSKRVRQNVYILFFLSLVINVGMWLERFVIIVISLHRDFLPSSWGMYVPTRWDWGMYIGTMGLFLSLMFLFVRFLPVISIFEVREMVHKEKEGHH